MQTPTMRSYALAITVILVFTVLTASAWTPPENLGGPANTIYNEIHCYPTPDALVLYFASDRPGGVGYLDIYVTEDDTYIAPASLGRIKGTFY